ncbi:hypothetical protein [Leucobacter sp. GX0328]
MSTAADAARAARTRSYYNPPRPRPRTLVEDLAVADLDKTQCPKSGGLHLIPATATVCLRCGTDALNRQDNNS